MVVTQGQVLGEREVEHQPAQLAILGDVRQAGVAGRAHAAAADLLAGDGDPARLCVAQPRDRLHQLVLAVAVDARQRHDLAAADGERQVPDRLQVAVVAHAQVLDLEHGRAELGVRLVHPQQHLAAHHQAREALLGRACGRHRVDLLAPAQHGHAVGDLQHLAELVADEHDRNTVVAQRPQHLEQLGRLLGGQHRRRLVEHQDARVAVERLEDLHALLRPDGHVLDHGIGVDRKAVALG